jgi:hypothetical protein
MPDLARFGVFMAAAFLLFVGVVHWVVRRRPSKPNWGVMVALATVVVPIGMLFARYAHIFFRGLPWEIYYGVPALTTFFLPPLWLRMPRREVARYVPLAVLMAPAIHVVFSLFVGWHDYMPFPAYIPSLAEILRGATR